MKPTVEIDYTSPLNFGNTPLHDAALAGRLELVARLIRRGEDVNATNRTGLTPLHEAAWGGHSEVAKLLIAGGAEINVEDDGGKTPLHTAIEEQHVTTAIFLLQHGAGTDQPDNFGETPLHVAVVENLHSVVDALVQSGADVDVANTLGHTPLDYAKRLQHQSVEEILTQAGAKPGVTGGSEAEALQPVVAETSHRLTNFEAVEQDAIIGFAMMRTCKFAPDYSSARVQDVMIPRELMPPERVAEHVLSVTLRDGRTIKGVVSDTFGRIIGIKSADGSQIEPNRIIRDGNDIIRVGISHHYRCVKVETQKQ